MLVIFLYNSIRMKKLHVVVWSSNDSSTYAAVCPHPPPPPPQLAAIHLRHLRRSPPSTTASALLSLVLPEPFPEPTWPENYGGVNHDDPHQDRLERKVLFY